MAKPDSNSPSASDYQARIPFANPSPSEVAGQLKAGFQAQERAREQAELAHLAELARILNSECSDLLRLVRPPTKTSSPSASGLSLVEGWKVDYGFALVDDRWQLAIRRRKTKIPTPMIDARNPEVIEGLQLVPEMLFEWRREDETQNCRGRKAKQLLAKPPSE